MEKKRKYPTFLYMSYTDTLHQVSEQAMRQYVAKNDDRLLYHNLAHTVRLLEAVNKMSTHYKLDDQNHFIVSVSAWLYDLEMAGYGSADTTKPGLSEEILKNAGLREDDIRAIKNCISNVGLPDQPVSLNEKIVRDAVSSYMGSENFIEYNKLRRKELEALSQNKQNGKAWRAKTISLLESHQFHTEYGQMAYNKIKEDNLQNLKRIQEVKHWQRHLDEVNHKQKKTLHDLIGNLQFPAEETAGGNAHSIRTAQVGSRAPLHPAWKNKFKHHLSGVETVFRNSSTNHLNLSVMADNKAFIMISVNSILISLGIGLIIGKFVLIPKLFIPTALLLFVNVFTIIYSVLATRPGLMKGTFTREDVVNRKVDLLFFGNFFKMPLNDFEFGMKEMMDDSDFLYDNLIRDIYAQGQILGRKFRLLRFSYNIFMYGTVTTVIAYIISFFI